MFSEKTMKAISEHKEEIKLGALCLGTFVISYAMITAACKVEYTRGFLRGIDYCIKLGASVAKD